MRSSHTRWLVPALAGLAICLGFAGAYMWPDAADSSAGTVRPAAHGAPLPARAAPSLLADAPQRANAPPEAIAAPRYHPRDAEEWQGMLVDVSLQALCSGATSCGLAAACIAGACGPCTADAQCGADELCVLDHCVLAHNAACRSRHDCKGSESRCMLTGYSADPRGNRELRANCVSPGGGIALSSDVHIPAGTPAPPPAIRTRALLDSVRAHQQLEPP